MKSGIDPTRIDPGFLQEITDPIGQLYEAATHDLLMSIASRLPALSLPRSLIPGGHYLVIILPPGR